MLDELDRATRRLPPAGSAAPVLRRLRAPRVRAAGAGSTGAQTLYDAVVDVLWIEIDAHFVAHILGPLHGVGPHDGRLVVLIPLSAVPRGKLPADFVPLLLGLDEDAVEIEDDGVDDHDN